MNILKKNLSNYYKLYFKIQSYHWNVKGQNFLEMHNFFQKLYTEFVIMIDDLAEKIVMIDGKINLYLEDIVKFSDISNPKQNISAKEMIDDIERDYNFLIQKVNEVIKKFSEQKSTEDLMIQHLSTLEKSHWMIKNYIS